MNLLERYILRRVFMGFLSALTATLAIVWTTQVLGRIDIVTDNGQSALTFFRIAALTLPSVIPLVVPFALIIAVTQTLSVMNTDSELAVISAAGGASAIVVRPVVALALAASLFCFVVHNFVEPYANQTNRELIVEARADLLSLIIQEGTFRKVEDGLYLQIGEKLPDGRLGGIFVADSREEGLDLAYYAKSGAVLERGPESMLLMFDGVVHRKTPTGDISVIRFTSYALDLALFASATNSITMFPKDRTISYLLSPEKNDKVFIRNPRLFQAELHRRFTEWAYPLVFALIALAVVGDARSFREARIHPMVTAIAIALFYRWLGFFLANRSQNEVWAGYAVYAVPIIPSILAIWFIRTHRPMELPIAWAEKLLLVLRRLADRLAFAWFRGRGTSAPAGGTP